MFFPFLFVVLFVFLVVSLLFRPCRGARREVTGERHLTDDENKHARTCLRHIISALVLSNAVYSLYCALLPPPNVFSDLRIPITTPTKKIRALLLRRTQRQINVLPEDLEMLITKLESSEVRMLYARLVVAAQRLDL